MKLIKNKGFTLIELLVTIAVLSVLVLLGAPRLTSYVQEAQLTRIQHDVKVMEQEMTIALLENEKLEGFDYNKKDLGLLIEANRLFEKEGHAESLEYVPAKGEINGLSKKERKISSKANSEIIGVGGVEYSTYDELGVGGDEIKIEEEKEFKEIYERYKIVPDNYKDKIKTKLKGTFYANENGKVYYEPDKPIEIKTEPETLNCDVALPDYEFEPDSGKIVKWRGAEQNLIIPSHFLVDDECVPVRTIGAGAFMRGGFKSIKIPSTVIIIEEEAFKESGVGEIGIPGSVKEIEEGAFDGIDRVVYFGGSSNEYSGSRTHLTRDNHVRDIVHRYPTAGEAGVAFRPEYGTIVRGSKDAGAHIPGYIDVDGIAVKVRRVAKGAYQGLELVTVELPEGLEVIDDYAFSGNKLIGVTIPNSVYHIGNYAFAFNEIGHHKDYKKATIKSVILKEQEQFYEINELGDISDSGDKIDTFLSSPELGPDVELLNHIWVTSISNIVIDVEDEPVGSGNEAIPEVGSGNEFIPDGYEMAEFADFRFISDRAAPNEYGRKGYYRYVGDKEYVVIPHIIDGNEIKDYYRMFEGSNVKGVASNNKNVTDMRHMFSGSTSTTIELKYLDTSSVTNMLRMFEDSQATTLDLSSFDTSSVTNMERMFYSSQATSLDLSSFDTSSVTNMERMFYSSQATTLNLSSFDTSKVTSMDYMFRGSQATTLDLSSFDTSSVTNMDGMFAYSNTTTLDLSSFDTSSVTSMRSMFSNSNATALNLSSFDTSSITDMNNMFLGSKATTLNLSSFDTSSVTNMSDMFRASRATTLDLSSFDTSSVTNMSNMFSSSRATTLDLSSFDTSSVTNRRRMFANAQATTGYARTQTDADKLNTGTDKPRSLTFIVKGNLDEPQPQPQPPQNVPDGYEMAEFEDFRFTYDSSAPNVYGRKGYYRYVGNKEYIVIPHIIDGHEIKDYYRMFEGSNVKGVASDNKNITNMRQMFYSSASTPIELKYLDTSSVTNMREMFRDSQATTLDLSSFDTSSVTNMHRMFYNSQATTLDLSSFDTSSVTDMSYMFYNSNATTLDLSSFDTSSVTNMEYMFYGSQATTLDLSSFGTSSVTSMERMFASSQASTLNLSSFDTSSVTSMRSMFRSSQATTLDLSSFDTSKVTNVYEMFAHSQATTLDLSSFDTSKVTNMYQMFRSSQATTLDLSSFDTSKVTSRTRMFQNSQATTGYARTEADADKLNKGTSKPSTLEFKVK